MPAKRRFNPKEYKEDFTDLAKVNPPLAAKAATDLARRKRNQDDALAESDMATKGLMAFMGTTAIMATAGWWNGSMKAKRDALIADWETEGAVGVGASTAEYPDPWDHAAGVSDPCCWWMVPKLILFPALTGGLAILAASMRPARKAPGGFERTMTMASGATLGLVIANMTAGWSYRRKEKKLMTTPVLESVKTGT